MCSWHAVIGLVSMTDCLFPDVWYLAINVEFIRQDGTIKAKGDITQLQTTSKFATCGHFLSA